MLHYAIILGLILSLSIVNAAVLPVFPFLNNFNKIVGGKPINIEEVPYQVSLNLNDFGLQHFCGGSILSEKFIMTAAHCTFPGESIDVTPYINVRTGSSYSESQGSLHRVKTIHRHSLYNATDYDYDFCILELQDLIQYDNTRRPIQLPKAGEDIENETILLTSGWGATQNVAESNDHLRAVEVPKMDQFECTLKYLFQNIITDRMFCAGVRGGGKDACQGDSGGPIVKTGTDGPRLVGVVSWGVGCALPQYPGVYGRLSRIRDWITEITDL
uniref:trypsin n=1 Tax=Phlebotomus papatasi TaxID=29031 RepID=Q7Z0G2_PHLPP|nr:trypsin 2 [Phlebotomus papatasi]